MVYMKEPTCQLQGTIFEHLRWQIKSGQLHHSWRHCLNNKAFDEHVHRAHFQVAIWRSALRQYPPNLNLCHFGWPLDETSQSLDFFRFPADVLPEPTNVLQLIKCGCASEQTCSTALVVDVMPLIFHAPFSVPCEHHCKNTGNTEYIEYNRDCDGDTDNVNLNKY